MKIKFIGAAQEVTGSKHLITTDKGKKIGVTNDKTCTRIERKYWVSLRNTQIDEKKYDNPNENKNSDTRGIIKNNMHQLRRPATKKTPASKRISQTEPKIKETKT